MARGRFSSVRVVFKGPAGLCRRFNPSRVVHAVDAKVGISYTEYTGCVVGTGRDSRAERTPGEL